MTNTRISNSSLRKQFQSFCGAEQYAKFLTVINTRAVYKRRLLYWQEKLWLSFCDRYPDYAHIEPSGLLDLFRICPIHDQPLLDDKVVAIYGNWRFPEDYLNARKQLFPFANMMHCGDSVDLQQNVKQDVVYCSACRDALIEWNADRQEKIGIP